MDMLVAWELREVGAPPVQVRRPIPTLADGEVVVRVAGCGLCHTDVSFAVDGVRTRHPLPLVLGHEISGVVQAASPGHEAWVGRPVVVPAVIPCGRCGDCEAGRSMICAGQVMPGNDVHGGFASHVVVPARGLCPVPGATSDPDAPLGPPGLTLRHLAVIADAVSTPYQALRRAEVSAGDLVVVVGLGGVGGYAVRLAVALGATVVGLEVDPDKLAAAEALGCHLALDPRADDPRALRKRIGAFALERGAPVRRTRILECSGTAAGQTTAFGLLNHGATLVVVGFTRDQVTVRLSNLMAFDARVLGTWGCAPELYPEIVRLVLDGAIDLVSGTEIRPLRTFADSLAAAARHELARRVVLAPDLPESP